MLLNKDKISELRNSEILLIKNSELRKINDKLELDKRHNLT